MDYLWKWKNRLLFFLLNSLFLDSLYLNKASNILILKCLHFFSSGLNNSPFNLLRFSNRIPSMHIVFMELGYFY